MKHLLRLLLSLVSEKALLVISNFPKLLYSSAILQFQLLVVLDHYMKYMSPKSHNFYNMQRQQ